MHVVERTEVVDRVSDTSLITLHRYRDGFFDPHEREFCGFAYAESEDAETSADGDVPPVLTRTWMHVGADLEVAGWDGDPQAPRAPAVTLPRGADPAARRAALRALAAASYARRCWFPTATRRPPCLRGHAQWVCGAGAARGARSRLLHG